MKTFAKPTRTSRYIIQPKIRMSRRQTGKNPNFPTLKAVGCKSPMLKTKKKKR